MVQIGPEPEPINLEPGTLNSEPLNLYLSLYVKNIITKTRNLKSTKFYNILFRDAIFS